MMDKTKSAAKRKFNLKSLKYGSNSVILIAIVIAMAVFINMIVGMIPAKWDLTPNKLYSITDTTKNILKNLNKDVVIYGLYDDAQNANDDNLKKVSEILNHYKSEHVKVEFVDPDKNVTILQQLDPDNVYKITKRNFVVKSGNKIKVLSVDDLFTSESDPYTGQTQTTGLRAEQAFTGAIKYVTSDKTPVVYFAVGHNEKDVDTNFSKIKSFLQNNNYDVKTVNLLTEPKVPDDTEILIFASPKNDLALSEKEKLKEYLKSGAKAIFMFDPLDTDVKLTNFNEILSDYNITINNDKIEEKDKTRFWPGQPYYIIPSMQSSAASILSGDVQLSTFNMVMPSTRSINILKNSKENLTVNSLAKTSASAEGVSVADGSRSKGPLDVAVMAEYTGQEKPTKLVVLGNSTFASDIMYQQGITTGIYFMLYTLNSLRDAKNDIVIAPKSYDSGTIDISQLQAQILGIIVVLVIPLIILATGTIVWVRRRHL